MVQPLGGGEGAVLARAGSTSAGPPAPSRADAEARIRGASGRLASAGARTDGTFAMPMSVQVNRGRRP